MIVSVPNNQAWSFWPAEAAVAVADSIEPGAPEERALPRLPVLGSGSG